LQRQGIATSYSSPSSSIQLKLPADVGDRVKHEQILRALTQDELAEMAGTTGETIHCMESGKSRPQLGTLHRIAAALGLPVQRFTREDDEL
jgi:transcriptional regulator with XRE-family HTH domain